MQRLVLFAVIAGFVGLIADTACGATIHVPTAEYLTITDGIDAASAGDTVQVAAGTYYENITMKSGVVIQGAGQGISIIDGGGSLRGVTATDVDSTATLDGFTIRNGRGYAGGGMLNNASSPTVSNCTFSENMTTTSSGGGMWNYQSSPTVTNCNFSKNTASVTGGGMYNVNSSSPTVTNCTFSENTANYNDLNYEGRGGGGMANATSSPTVTNCTFSENTAYLGGAISNSESSPTVTNCGFSGNTAIMGGGGMFNYSSSPTMTNCIFSGNTAGANGAGIFNDRTFSPTVTNCTFSGNTAYNVGGGMYNISSSPTVTNCILWGDNPNEISNYSSAPSVTYSDIQGDYTGTGNITVNPLFVDAANGDLHLKPFSPCIDSGDNSAPSLPTADIDGDDRKIDDSGVIDSGNGFTPFVDMGADEFSGTSQAGDINSDGLINLADAITALKTCTAIPPDSPVSAKTDINGDQQIGNSEAIFVLQKVSTLRE